MLRILLAITLLGTGPLLAQSDEELQRLEELDADCTRARDANLQVLREQKVRECLQAPPEPRADPKTREECERYWGDFGATTGSASGARGNFLYSDLPECVRAFEARQQYRK